jgi:hypothetical protein
MRWGTHNYLQPGQPCYGHYQKTEHNTEDCPELIEKWEAWEKMQHSVNMLNSEPWILGGDEVHPSYTSLYIITWGG